MNSYKLDRNQKLYDAIKRAGFASISAFARHVALSYRNVESYAKFERRPVDRKGVVKYDIAAVCEALDCSLEDIFPAEFIDTPYRFKENYEDNYGQRAKKEPITRYFTERSLTTSQAQAILSLISFSSVIPDDAAHGFAELAVRRLSPIEYQMIERKHFEGETDPFGYGDSKRYQRACRTLNMRSNQELAESLRNAHAAGESRDKILERLAAAEAKLGKSTRVELTKEVRARIRDLRDRSGLGPYNLLKWAAQNNVPIPEGVTGQPLDNALTGRTKTIAAFLLEFAEDAWQAAIEAKTKDSL